MNLKNRVMRSLFVTTILLSILLSCKKNKEDCVNTIEVNSIENIEYHCNYVVNLSTDTTITFEFIEINDFRSYGSACMSSTGGFAELFFKLEHIERERTIYANIMVTGCGGDIDFPLDYQGLPNYTYGSFNLIVTKLLPLSFEINEKPSSINQYTIKMGVLR